MVYKHTNSCKHCVLCVVKLNNEVIKIINEQIKKLTLLLVKNVWFLYRKKQIHGKEKEKK